MVETGCVSGSTETIQAVPFVILAILSHFQYFHLFTQASIPSSFHLSIQLSIHPSIHPFYLSFCPFFNLSIIYPIHPSIYLSILSSMYVALGSPVCSVCQFISSIVVYRLCVCNEASTCWLTHRHIYPSFLLDSVLCSVGTCSLKVGGGVSLFLRSFQVTAD